MADFHGLDPMSADDVAASLVAFRKWEAKNYYSKLKNAGVFRCINHHLLKRMTEYDAPIKVMFSDIFTECGIDVSAQPDRFFRTIVDAYKSYYIRSASRYLYFAKIK